MSQNSSPDVQPVRDTNAPSSSGASELHTFFSEWCEAKRYTVQEVIGKGSYGVVCAAVDNANGEKVAIKKIQNVFENVADATRILREIKLVRLLKHPDVVDIKHILLPPDPRNFKDIYVVFELMESDLHTVIGANDDLTADHHKVFLYQLLRGLNFIHSSGVLHRDLKPKNILANSNCKLKICDFGLARPFIQEQANTPVYWTDYVATRWYRAPELCGCFYGRYSQAVDIWSIGCIFAEVLLGKPLFPGRDAVGQLQLITDLVGKPTPRVIERISNQKARAFLAALPHKNPRFEAKFPHVDRAALELLKKLLSFDPSERPTAAEALADPYFAGLPNATAQEPATISRQQFEFELHSSKLTEAEVRSLIYQEVLQYHPAVQQAYQAQCRAQQYAMPITSPGCDVDLKCQFMLAEQYAANPQAAAAVVAAAQQMAVGKEGWYKAPAGYAAPPIMPQDYAAAMMQYDAAAKLYPAPGMHQPNPYQPQQYQQTHMQQAQAAAAAAAQAAAAAAAAATHSVLPMPMYADPSAVSYGQAAAGPQVPLCAEC
mmetsp:Transcript_28012/g.71404  ORF Transcript_28012/g.71404 Transcript_28012/m.71404 type:complete len:545 (-) Transcript_28012:1250-2884(-)